MSNGNHYGVFVKGSAISSDPIIRYADNGDNTWNKGDEANAPQNSSNLIAKAVYGSKIYVAHNPTSGGAGTTGLFFHIYDTSSETWTVVDEPVLPSSATQTGDNISLGAFSDGRAILAYGRTTSSQIHFYYRIRSTGGVWGSEVTLVHSTSVTYGNCKLFVDSDDIVHFVYSENTNIDTYYRKLVGGSLTTQYVFDTGIGVSVMTWAEGVLSGQKALLVGQVSQGNPGSARAWISTDDGDSFSGPTTVSSKVGQPSFTTPSGNFFWDGTKFCAVYIGRSASGNAGYNLAYYNGTTWTADIVMQNVATRGVQGGYVINDAGYRMIAYFYNTGTGAASQSMNYNEYADPNLVFPTRFVNTNVFHTPVVAAESAVQDLVWMMH